MIDAIPTPLTRYADFLQGMNKESVKNIGLHVTSNVIFSDPFNRVCGVDKMRCIFEDMYETLGDVHFDILHQATNGQTGFLHWKLSATLRNKPWEVDGVSHLTFDETGKVSSHIDHWDAARDFYEYFPAIGWVLSTIRKRLSVKF